MGTMDGIIDTVSGPHAILPLTGLLNTNGKLILVGAPTKSPELPLFPLIMGKFFYLISLIICFGYSSHQRIVLTKVEIIDRKEAYSWECNWGNERDPRDGRFCSKAQYHSRCGNYSHGLCQHCP